jgi:hypothetical protein
MLLRISEVHGRADALFRASLASCICGERVTQTGDNYATPVHIAAAPVYFKGTPTVIGYHL